ncbi:MAG TPA: class I mannose-6-phosphate isomerase [Deinococcales bacterium]|nr:class I mannose-6-phosphate isomerase [Deinococcales bacterium]
MTSQDWRRTSQDLMPARKPEPPEGAYDLYPSHPCPPGTVRLGVAALADALTNGGASTATLDGATGVLWEELRHALDEEFSRRGVSVAWRNVDAALGPPAEVQAMLAPFLGGDDPIFGFVYPGGIADFFSDSALAALTPDGSAGLSIVYGCGAALAAWRGNTVYCDVPKNEQQFRARAGRVVNLGAADPADAKATYKRLYFVDWQVQRRHAAHLLPGLAAVADLQRPDEPTVMAGADFRAALGRMAGSFLRVRPWFEPGPWGGQWLKERVPQLPREAPNYAWSFELISPENGIVLESDGLLLEASFDFLMAQEARAVLGEAHPRFGSYFPIRFDYLDTFAGGNLSVQCHPHPEYIAEHFGEPFTQDETYYILDCAPGARVYLGLQEDADLGEFRAALERSQARSEPLDVDRYVASQEAVKHGLYLIPNGTVHCSGTDNLVLEISATPYIFTFKMYDWLRLDLDGKPRPINLGRAFANIRPERRGERVARELVSRPVTLDEGHGWRTVHLPTHPDHFYDVHRLELTGAIDVRTENRCHVLNVVEGGPVEVESGDGQRAVFRFAETFIVPAAAGSYRVSNRGAGEAKVVLAFVKDGHGPIAAPAGAG